MDNFRLVGLAPYLGVGLSPALRQQADRESVDLEQFDNALPRGLLERLDDSVVDR